MSPIATTDPSVVEEIDYSKEKLADLKKLCKERELRGYSTLKKLAIIDLLKEFDVEEKSNLTHLSNKRIRNKYIGKFIPLPRETSGFFFSYAGNNNYQLSVVLKPRKRTIRAYWQRADPREVEISTPQIILSANLLKSSLNISSDMRIFEQDTENKKAISCRVYDPSNVYSGDAKICFGNKKILDFRHANSTFWNGPFNHELTPKGGWTFRHDGNCPNVVHHNNRHRPDDHPGNHPHNHIKSICSCITPSRRLHHRETGAPACWNCGCHIIEDPSERIQAQEVIQKIGRYCKCCVSAVSAGMECGCKCNCMCCKVECGCSCNCSTSESDGYSSFLKNFESKNPWVDKTSAFLGSHYKTEDRKFVSYPGSTCGLVMIFSENIIKALKLEKYIRTENYEGKNANTRTFVLGMAKEYDSESFIVSFGRDKFITVKKDRVKHCQRRS